MNRHLAVAALAVGGLAAITVPVLTASPAAAHTPTHAASCSGVNLRGTAYDANAGNTWAIYLNGVVWGSGTFGASLNVTAPVAQGGAVTAYRVTINAPGTAYDYDRSGSVGPCGTATPTPTPSPTPSPTPTPTPSVPTEPPPTTVPPSEPPTTVPTTVPPSTPPTTPPPVPVKAAKVTVNTGCTGSGWGSVRNGKSDRWTAHSVAVIRNKAGEVRGHRLRFAVVAGGTRQVYMTDLGVRMLHPGDTFVIRVVDGPRDAATTPARCGHGSGS